MVTLMKVISFFASFIMLSLLSSCGVDSDDGVGKASALALELLEQSPDTECKVPAAATSQEAAVQPLVSLSELVDHADDLVEPVTFTVLTYNVENLFDVDGFSKFDDYKVNSGYSPRKLLTKLRISPMF